MIRIILILFISSSLYGQGVTNLYFNKIISSGGYVFIDSDAQAYYDTLNKYVDFNTLQTSLDSSDYAEAIDSLFLRLKGNGTTNGSNVYDSLDILYPFIGGSATSHRYNALDPQPDTLSFYITWNGTVTHDSLGVKSDGSTGYGNTYFNPDRDGFLNNTHVSYYDRIEKGGASQLSGVVDGASEMRLGSSTSWSWWSAYNSGAGRVLPTDAAVIGHLLGNRVSSTNNRVLKNGSLSGSNATSGGSLPNGNFLILGSNENGSLNFEHNQPMQCFTLGRSLTTSQESDLYEAIFRLQQILNRE